MQTSKAVGRDGYGNGGLVFLLYITLSITQQMGFLVSRTNFGHFDDTLYFLNYLVGSFDNDSYNTVFFCAITVTFFGSWLFYAHIIDRPNMYHIYKCSDEHNMFDVYSYQDKIFLAIFLTLIVISILGLNIFSLNQLQDIEYMEFLESFVLGISLGIMFLGVLYFGSKLLNTLLTFCSRQVSSLHFWRYTKTTCEFIMISVFIPYASLGINFENIALKVISFFFTGLVILLFFMFADASSSSVLL